MCMCVRGGGGGGQTVVHADSNRFIPCVASCVGAALIIHVNAHSSHRRASPAGKASRRASESYPVAEAMLYFRHLQQHFTIVPSSC